MVETDLLPCPFCGDTMEGFAGCVPGAFASGGGKFAVECDCGALGGFAPSMLEAIAAWNRRAALSGTREAGEPVVQHPDDEAVDRFAASMKAKIRWEREERGRSGWDNPNECSPEYLVRLLIEHLGKGNPGNFEDVANFCMMLHQRGCHPRVLAEALAAPPAEVKRGVVTDETVRLACPQCDFGIGLHEPGCGQLPAALRPTTSEEGKAG